MAMAAVALVLWVWTLVWSAGSVDDDDLSDDGAPPVAKIDVNAADAATLQALPSVGPAIAHRIVEYRRSHGPFRRVEDLRRIPGITDELIARIRPFLADVSGSARPAAAEGDR